MSATVTRSHTAPFTPPAWSVRPYPYGVGWWVTRNGVPQNWFPTWAWARAINEARARNAAARLRREREEQS